MSFAQFNQNYEMKEILGHGSQSTVRKVIRRDTQQVFAAKIYQASGLVKAKHEIDMLVKLDHPSIVNIYEVYEEENCIILVLQYMAGGELYEQISQRKRLTQGQVRNLMRILIDAIRYCHELEIIHRDIKPENLLLTTNGPDALLKLSDFGISKILSDGELNTICGTPIYMAPEIWRFQPYDSRVDIWSMGVVTYYLLSGQYPFQGENTQQLLQRVLHEQASFKQKIWESVSSRAIVLLRQMLRKDRHRRPSALEVQNHIWFVDVEPISRYIQDDTNLLEAIVSIGRNQIKTKRIKKQKELKELIHPKNLSKARVKFLLMREEDELTQQSTFERGQIRQ